MSLTAPQARRLQSSIASSKPEMRLAAIDVGSNSLHMIVAQADPDGGVTTLWRLKEMVGLGRMSFPSHRLSAQAMDQAITTLHRFEDEAVKRGAEKIIAVATSAVREAENGGDFIERARRELGMQVRVVSAREEARLIYLAVRHAVNFAAGPHLIVDIGGGSVEFIVADATRPLLLESRKLGAARMTAKYVKSDPIEARDLKSLLKHYEEELTPLIEHIQQLKPVKIFGTSGTLENLAEMCGTADIANGDGQRGIIDAHKLERLVSDLVESRSKDRAKMNGLDEQRQDQIVAGALLVHELFRRLKISKIHLCKSALREGILVDYLARHLPELAIRRTVPDPRRRSVLDLARRSNWHQAHSEQVAKICMQLFDSLKSLHELGRRNRELIEYGALLHDIGWHIARAKHHKHSMYLIMHGDLKGFNAEEVAVIAHVARYHRKSPPNVEHESYAQLSARARKTVDVGAALLRISDGLDRSHCSVISSVKAKIGKRKVELRLEGRDAQLEIWGARKKADWFVELFDRTITFAQK